MIRSPNEFRAELSDAWGTRAGDDCKVAIDITTRIQELSVIKDVKEFATELESFLLRDRKAFAQAHIKIVDAGAVEKPSVGRPECSQRSVRCECVREEVQPVVFAGIDCLHRTDLIWHIRRGT